MKRDWNLMAGEEGSSFSATGSMKDGEGRELTDFRLLRKAAALGRRELRWSDCQDLG